MVNGKKVTPLPLDHIIKENILHSLYTVVVSYMSDQYKEKPSLQSFQDMNNMWIANREFYTFRERSLLSKQTREMFYRFVLTVSKFLDEYSNKTYLQQFMDNVRRKHIMVHVVTRGHGIKKLLIQPWRSVVQSDDKAIGYDGKLKFDQVILELLQGVDLNSIVTVQVSTNIKAFDVVLKENPIY